MKKCLMCNRVVISSLADTYEDTCRRRRRWWRRRRF